MSFLLDALGKADHDRRRSEVPELRTYNRAGHSSVRSVLRGLALVGLLFLFFALGYISHPYLEKTLAGHRVAEMSVAPPQGIEPVGKAVEPAPVPDPIAEGLLQQSAGRLFELEVISYSDTPTARFAMINGAMVREGEVLVTGEILLMIEPDAVLLEQAGKQIRIGM